MLGVFNKNTGQYKTALSNEGDIVCDLTMGSGSTGVAAMNTSRNFIGIEKDDHYFEIAQKRLEEAVKSNSNTSHFLIKNRWQKMPPSYLKI